MCLCAYVRACVPSLFCVFCSPHSLSIPPAFLPPPVRHGRPLSFYTCPVQKPC
ncbi:hypothetical protein PICMEDRAFT_17856 [Pichia membranifaciens NRRL Y-2026]|uniref:Uncharacterized protein n=1 Tax=Pichia membranifaciens NRRL Y-2026 TaxID=763406 RepID=A0A1E3NGV3_9ASCO|nr:hypothetical protein PICMEDRAFT_17856 [Pichia membranifaciens NRRL Y-2026]ODQ45385.1 hypothetical protein PICMEDRAFT_17856 [Pichia membranifaciens NRRL Y-2026]